MSLTAHDPGGGGDFTPAPEGTHIARCVQLIDIGTQFSEYYKTSKRKVILGFELPGQKNDDGEPFLIWQRYTNSLHENARMRGHLESWRGKRFTDEELEGFPLQKILDVPCLVSIGHDINDGKTYARVNSIMALPQGTTVPDRFHKIVKFDIEEFDVATYESFSANLKKTIDRSEERSNGQAQAEPVATGGGSVHKPITEADIPFSHGKSSCCII